LDSRGSLPMPVEKAVKGTGTVVVSGPGHSGGEGPRGARFGWASVRAVGVLGGDLQVVDAACVACQD
jgi:hypothetical protein